MDAVDPQVEDSTVLVAAAAAVRRVVSARISDPHLVKDLCQETMARVLDRRDGLEPSAVLPYAVVTARNLVVSRAREQERASRHLPLLIDLREPEDPADSPLRQDERRSLREALGQLSEQERAALVSQEVEGTSVRQLAEAHGTSPGAFAVRMAAVRAKLRVEYVLSYRRVTLPTERCRPVLVALSAGDRRRQRLLDAGDHLLRCDTCASLSEPLLRRDRALAGWWPIPLVAPAAKLAIQAAKGNPVMTTAASATVVAGVAGGALVLADRPQPPPPAPQVASPSTTAPPARSARIEVEGTPVLPLPTEGDLARYAGRTVNVRGAEVLSVAANEGFWLGPSREQRLWVQLVDTGPESPAVVRRGQRVSFDGRIVPNPSGFATAAGVGPGEGALLLERQGHHIEVPARSVLVRDG